MGCSRMATTLWRTVIGACGGMERNGATTNDRYDGEYHDVHTYCRNSYHDENVEIQITFKMVVVAIAQNVL